MSKSCCRNRKEVKMYVNVRRYEGAGKIDEVTQLVEKDFLPLIRKVPGFLAYYAVDARYGVAVTISIFEDQVGAIEADRLAENWVSENLTSTFPNSPEVTSGDVVVYDFIDSGNDHSC
jgi:hypothetical protein